MNYKNLNPGERLPEIVNCIIEIPKKSRNKIEYDPDLMVFKLDRVLHASVHYPADYGFIPGTLYEDGDPVDILVLISEPTFTGCLVRVKPIGLLRMIDEAGKDDKILSVAIDDPTYREYEDVSNLPSHILIEIEHFFKTYKILEGKAVESFGWESAKMAKEAILKARERYLLKVSQE